MYLNLRQILGDFFPDNQKAMFAICPFCLKKLKCLGVFNLSLAQFKRTHNFSGTGAQVCLAPCPLPRHFLNKPNKGGKMMYLAVYKKKKNTTLPL